MKAIATHYKGIEFVSITDLPADQREEILFALDRENFITILLNEKTLRNCIQYKDYIKWDDGNSLPKRNRKPNHEWVKHEYELTDKTYEPIG